MNCCSCSRTETFNAVVEFFPQVVLHFENRQHEIIDLVVKSNIVLDVLTGGNTLMVRA